MSERPPLPMTRSVFVIGCPRSGTSALSWALAQHPAFITGPESDFIYELFGRGHLHATYRAATSRADDPWLVHNHVIYPELCHYLGLGVDALFASRAEGRRWVDASPSHTLIAGDLALMFPAACFLHIVRDGRAVVASMLKSGFDTDWATSFEKACRAWVHYVECGLAFEQQFPHRVLRVEHRSILADASRPCKEIGEFLGIDDTAPIAAYLSSHRINSSHDNERPEDVRKVKSVERLHDDPTAGWSDEQRHQFEAIAGGCMRRIGLATAAVPPG